MIEHVLKKWDGGGGGIDQINIAQDRDVLHVVLIMVKVLCT